MGIQGMLASIKNNKRKRKSVFNKKEEKIDATYSKFDDHKKMTTYEFHEFQKKIKNENAQRQQKFILKSAAAIFLLLAIVIYLLYFIEY